MATLRELIIKVSANSQSFQTEIARASRMGLIIIRQCRMAAGRLRLQFGKLAVLLLS